MKKIMVFLVSSLMLNPATTQNMPTGIFRLSGDIGNPQNHGLAVYTETDQSYRLKGSGYNIWFDRDELYFLYNKIKGDFILTADFELTGKGGNAHRKTGWMVRENSEGNSPHVSAALHGNGLTVMQWRSQKG